MRLHFLFEQKMIEIRTTNIDSSPVNNTRLFMMCEDDIENGYTYFTGKALLMHKSKHNKENCVRSIVKSLNLFI